MTSEAAATISDPRLGERHYYAKCGSGKRHEYRYDKGSKERVCLNCGNVRGSKHREYQVHVAGLAP